MTRQTVTLFVPDGYASGKEFAEDCGFEIAKPAPMPWDAGGNYCYAPVEELAAKIYAGFIYDGPGDKPAWTPHGNGLKQDEARYEARRRLRIAGHVQVEVE